MEQFKKNFILFLIGGIFYYIIEILWRGYSHWSMSSLGGLCFLLIGLINEYYSWDMPLWKQMGISTIIITVLEFITGIVVNIWLRLNIWDYSSLPFNLLGQICFQYSLLWFWLSLVGIMLDDWLRFWLFGEEKPHYKLF